MMRAHWEDAATCRARVMVAADADDYLMPDEETDDAHVVLVLGADGNSDVVAVQGTPEDMARLVESINQAWQNWNDTTPKGPEVPA